IRSNNPDSINQKNLNIRNNSQKNNYSSKKNINIRSNNPGIINQKNLKIRNSSQNNINNSKKNINNSINNPGNMVQNINEIIAAKITSTSEKIRSTTAIITLTES
ncbi:hypothetical protein KSS87_023871, partial [Heliosperma pusillum]